MGSSHWNASFCVERPWEGVTRPGLCPRLHIVCAQLVEHRQPLTLAAALPSAVSATTLEKERWKQAKRDSVHYGRACGMQGDVWSRQAVH